MIVDEAALAALIRAAVRAELDAHAATKGDEYVSTHEAARILQVTPDTIRDWQDEGKLPKYWAGRLVRVRLGDLHALARTPPARELSPEEAARVAALKKSA